MTEHLQNQFFLKIWILNLTFWRNFASKKTLLVACRNEEKFFKKCQPTKLFFWIEMCRKFQFYFEIWQKFPQKKGEYITQIYLIFALTSHKKIGCTGICTHPMTWYYSPTRFIHPFVHPMSIEDRRGILGLEAANAIIFCRIARLPLGSCPASFSFPSVA
jgi:hypothetical protein